MPVLYPGSLVGWLPQQFFNQDGAPLIAGKLFSYEAGTDVPQPTYTDVNLAPGTEHTNPIILDSTGRPENGPIYVLPTGYKWVCTTSEDVVLWTLDNSEDVGAVFANELGIILGEGARNVVSGYQCLVSDRLVTVDSAGGADPCIVLLVPAADATQPITIKSFGTIPVAITCSGTDRIDANLTVLTLPAATASVAPSALLVPSPPSDWYILASHGVV